MTSVQERIFDVTGSRVVVTGAASGLGFAMAEVLAECGARVTLADIAEERLAASTERLRARRLDVRACVVDVADEDAVQALLDEVVAEQGGVDVVFANAGLAAVPGFRSEDGQTLVFVEVKARATAEFGTAAEAVTRRKQLRLVRMARDYLARAAIVDRPCRFDVVAIDEVETSPRITVYPHAFDATG